MRKKNKPTPFWFFLLESFVSFPPPICPFPSPSSSFVKPSLLSKNSSENLIFFFVSLAVLMKNLINFRFLLSLLLLLSLQHANFFFSVKGLKKNIIIIISVSSGFFFSYCEDDSTFSVFVDNMAHISHVS